MQRTYLAIDLKSYYASAECAARHLDPLTTNLVVADSSRTEKTICLAVSPSLKTYGIPGRARLFEVVQKVKEVNANRLREAVRLRKAVYKDGNSRIHLLFQVFSGIILRLQLLPAAAGLPGFIWSFLSHDYSCSSSGNPSGSWKKVIFLPV